jgi:glycosyltransferase involved in cell wall biosynthesis
MSSESLPTVSILTPTYNRRDFLPQLIKLVATQDYPKELIEWIILDDGELNNEELFADIPYARYIYEASKRPLAEKRNCLNGLASNQILVNMDDDDYYPPTRISYAVEAILDSGAEIAGSTVMYVYAVRDKKIYQFGPINVHHGTAATFACTKEYANTHRYGNSDFAEEGNFTNRWSEPMAQMNPVKTIMALSHSCNTVDKNLLIDQHATIVQETTITLEQLVVPEMIDFYRDLEYVEIPACQGLSFARFRETKALSFTKSARQF